MNRQRTKNAVWSWEATGAVCCFAGGISSALLGSVLTASTWVLGAEAHPWVRGLGTALLILTIPLLILAGYCMDWAEREPKKSRLPTSENDERGSVPVYQTLVFAIFLTVVLMAPLELHAQQTVFNVPTTDVLDNAGGARLSADDPGVHSHLHGIANFRHVTTEQCGTTWLVGNSLCLYFRHGEQRFGLRGHFGKHALV